MSTVISLLMVLSAACFLGSIFYIIRSVVRKVRSNKTAILFVWSFIAICLMNAAIYLAGSIRFLPSEFLLDVFRFYTMDSAHSFWAATGLLKNAGLHNLFIWYSAIIYNTAPIIAGVAVLEILTDLYPAVYRMIHRRSPVYVFSEMNERSVILAEELARDRQEDKMIIFAGCDKEMPQNPDLLDRIKMIRAVRLPEDAVSCRGLKHARKCSVFLMNRDDQGFDDNRNLTMLSRLLGDGSDRLTRSGDIFLFADSAEMVENVKAVKQSFDGSDKDKEKKKSDIQIKVKVVRDTVQTAALFLKDEPLFLPLGERPTADSPKRLGIAVFGTGEAALEMIKSVYWCSQMPYCCPEIAVITKPGEGKRLIDRLNKYVPELEESCTPNSECLRIYPGREIYARPYARLSVIEEDVLNANMKEVLTADRAYLPFCGAEDESFTMADYDYFFAAEDSDEANAELSGELIRLLNVLQLEGRKRDDKGSPYVAVHLQNEKFAGILRERYNSDPDRKNSVLKNIKRTEVRMYGGLRDCYSVKKVFLDEFVLGSSVDPSEHGSANEFADVTSLRDDIYETFSKFTRAIHLPYKAYSAGFTDGNGKVSAEMEEAFFAAAEDTGNVEFRGLQIWQEHRRWNAYIRSQGFSRPSEVDHIHEIGLDNISADISKKILGEKDIPLLLHPCLVEIDTDGMHDLKFGENSTIEPRYDKLDLISLVRNRFRLQTGEDKGTEGRDVKKYDIPSSDWGRIRNQTSYQ